MIPFYEFGQWWRRAKSGERISAVAGFVVIIALLVWAIIPGSSSSTTSASATTGTQAAAGSGGKCTNPSGTVQGVTDKTIDIAVVLTNITGLATNASAGVLPLADQKADFAALVKATNAAGGVDCRQLVPHYFNGNPADQASLQGTCLSIVQSKPFAVLDAGAFAQFPQVDCFPQHQVPYFGGYILPQAQMQKFYPYLFQFNNADSLYQTAIVGLNTQGFFNPAKAGQKLGLLYATCDPQYYPEVRSQLAKVGVPASSVVAFNVGCPNPFTSSVTLEQAILKFKAAHVTAVTTVAERGDLPTFTKLAASQNFKPKYGLPDDQIVFGTYGTSPPDLPAIDGALAVSQNRDGEERTPGYQPSSGTVACNKIIEAAGQKPVYQSLSGGGGNACDEMWEFAAAVNHEPSLSQSLLPEGLQAAKSVDFSFPQGPNDYTAGHVTWSGQFYRINQFHLSCKCWQLVTHNFARSVP